MKQPGIEKIKEIISQNKFYLSIITGIIVVLVITIKFYAPRYVSTTDLVGESMKPTFETGDEVLINYSKRQITYLHHGQFVIISKVPNGSDRMLKRIIGLPGDHLVIEHGQVIRNGEKIEEPYLNEEQWLVKGKIEVYLKENEIYVMGDNRNYSTDSRQLGPIDLNTQYQGVVVKQTK